MSALIIIALASLLVLLLYHITTKTFDYWEKKKVRYAKPVPFFGNYAAHIQMRLNSGIVCQKLCQQFRDQPYFGTFYGTDPALVVLDPEIIKLVFTKDFYYFSSREGMDYNHRETVTQNLFFAHGDKWRIVRQNLTPFFSSSKLKNMFHLIQKCAYMHEDLLDYETKKSNIVSTKALMIRYTMDCICSCGFGVDTNTQAVDSKENPFTTIGNLLFSSSYIRAVRIVWRTLWPKIFYSLGFKCFAPEIDVFFFKMLTGVFESRNYKPSPRNDFVDLLLNWKNQKNLIGASIDSLKTGDIKKVELEITDELLVSQCAVFFGAGFETSASALSLTIYELAKNPEAQRRAQKEVDEYLNRTGNKLTYDCVTDLPYVNACVAETTRLYPVFGILTREVVEDYRFPSGLQLERGARVHLPVYYLHHNPEHFPEPERYKPERFLPDAEHVIKPFTFFPFGEGPRYCIGSRFSRMQITPGLIAFLKKYSVELAEGTPETLGFETTTMLMQPASELRLKVTPRSGWEQRVFVRGV